MNVIKTFVHPIFYILFYYNKTMSCYSKNFGLKNIQMSTTNLVAVIFSYKDRANYHEILEGWPNFCIPLYVHGLTTNYI